MEQLSLPTALPPGPGSPSEVESVSDPMEELDPQSDLSLSLEQLLEHDHEWEDELDPHPGADPHCFIVVMASMLVFMKSQQTNLLQMML
ncbi:hypothetical protein BGZ74_006734, partial [Mortierella antarctica]